MRECYGNIDIRFYMGNLARALSNSTNMGEFDISNLLH